MRKVKPYYFEYKSFAKGRWLGRTLLDVFSSEFRDRSEDYYVSAPPPRSIHKAHYTDILMI